MKKSGSWISIWYTYLGYKSMYIWSFSSLGPIFKVMFNVKNLPKSRYIFGIVFQKIDVLRFKMVSNGKILKNFDEIAYKTPHRLFLENFRKFRKISKIFENLTPKTPQNSLFIAFLRRNFWPSVLFYGSKKPILCCWDPPPFGSAPKNISGCNACIIWCI